MYIYIYIISIYIYIQKICIHIHKHMYIYIHTHIHTYKTTKNISGGERRGVCVLTTSVSLPRPTVKVGISERGSVTTATGGALPKPKLLHPGARLGMPPRDWEGDMMMGRLGGAACLSSSSNCNATPAFRDDTSVCVRFFSSEVSGGGGGGGAGGGQKQTK
jgi:hypothetical protein